MLSTLKFIIEVRFEAERMKFKTKFIIHADIDECSSRSSPCGLNAECQNTSPGYQCSCPQGFIPSPSPDVACVQVNNNNFH